MKRIALVSLLGAMACGPKTQPLETPPPKARPDAGVAITDYDLAASASNERHAPLAIEGDVLFQEIDERTVWKWDLITMKRIDVASFLDPHQGFVALPDGSVALWAERGGQGDCVIYRLVTPTELTTHKTTCGRNSDRLLQGPGGTLYSVRDDEIAQLRLRGTAELELVGEIPLPPRVAQRDQMFSLADGRIAALDHEGLVILAPGKPATKLPMAKRFPRHIAPATGERFWYSRGPTLRGAIDTLVLASLDDPMRDVRAINVAPSRIVHMASSGSAIAVLLAGPEGSKRWNVALFDETGSERWRSQITDLPSPANRLNQRGAVALSKNRVVLDRHDRVLLAWDAKTGAPVAVEQPKD